MESGKPLRRGKLVDEIIETLRQDIVTRKLPHGSSLLEKEVCDRFGVSPPTAREAIRALEMIGLVNVVHGNGSFVRSEGDFAVASALQTLLQLESVGIMEVLDVRQVLGRRSIELAASNATDEDISTVALACDRYDRLGEVKELDELIQYVVDFQRAVSAASHSPLLQTLEAFLLALLNEVQMNSVAGQGLRFLRARAMEFQPHRLAILEGLRSGDRSIARAAMDDYFDAQRALFDRDATLRELSLSSPALINVISNMVRRFK